MKNKDYYYALLFVIFLVVVTVFSWKGCSEIVKKSSQKYEDAQVYQEF